MVLYNTLISKACTCCICQCTSCRSYRYKFHFLIFFNWHIIIDINAPIYITNANIPHKHHILYIFIFLVCQCLPLLTRLPIHQHIFSFNCSGPYPNIGLSGIIFKQAFHNLILPVPAPSASRI